MKKIHKRIDKQGELLQQHENTDTVFRKGKKRHEHQLEGCG